MKTATLCLSLALTTQVLSSAFAEEPTTAYCERNRIEAEQAAADSLATRREIQQVVTTGVVGGSCGILLYFAAVDGGLTAAICGTVAAITFAASSTPAQAADGVSSKMAGNAWASVRDMRCVKP